MSLLHHNNRVFRNRARQRCAFTLLEMLLATGLSVILLAALWQLFGTYARLFDRGQQQVESSQLARSLMQLFTDDLGAAIQDPISGGDTVLSDGQPQRRFGLLGTSTELRVDILRLTPERGNPNPVGRAMAAGDAENAVRVPELRTVVYSFQDILSADGSATDGMVAGAPTGLVRREMDFETPVGSAMPGEGSPMLDAPGAGGLFSGDSAGGAASDPTATSVPTWDDAFISVPEVASISFRYFDGNGWSGSWNSLQRKSLPAAVEVTIVMAAVTDKDRRGAAGDPMESTADPEALDTKTPDAGSVTHRLVVELPGSSSYQKQEPKSPSRTATVPRTTVRRIVPRRWQPSSGQPQRRGPDDWLRKPQAR